MPGFRLPSLRFTRNTLRGDGGVESLTEVLDEAAAFSLGGVRGAEHTPLAGLQSAGPRDLALFLELGVHPRHHAQGRDEAQPREHLRYIVTCCFYVVCCRCRCRVPWLIVAVGPLVTALVSRRLSTVATSQAHNRIKRCRDGKHDR